MIIKGKKVFFEVEECTEVVTYEGVVLGRIHNKLCQTGNRLYRKYNALAFDARSWTTICMKKVKIIEDTEAGELAYGISFENAKKGYWFNTETGWRFLIPTGYCEAY